MSERNTICITAQISTQLTSQLCNADVDRAGRVTRQASRTLVKAIGSAHLSHGDNRDREECVHSTKRFSWINDGEAIPTKRSLRTPDTLNSRRRRLKTMFLPS